MSSLSIVLVIGLGILNLKLIIAIVSHKSNLSFLLIKKLLGMI